MTETKKTFAHAEYYQSMRSWGFIDHEGEFMPAEHLVGKVVNIGDKNGLTFDTTTVVSFSSHTGKLLLNDGTYASWLRPEESPRPIENLEMPMHEIARGYIHEEPADEH